MPTLDEYRAHLRERLDLCRVPESLHSGLVEYFAARRRPGGFLSAVLQNDLRDAVLRADVENLARIGSLVMFLVNYTPATAWGSEDVFNGWLGATDPPPLLFE